MQGIKAGDWESEHKTNLKLSHKNGDCSAKNLF